MALSQGVAHPLPTSTWKELTICISLVRKMMSTKVIFD
jgi:hypothetical protein